MTSLTEVSLANFRGFSSTVTLTVKPITVLIGQNSSGKSSIIKFLQMLRQTLENSDEGFLLTEGRHVHLGAFLDLRNRKSRSKYFRFWLKVKSDDLYSFNVLNVLDWRLKRNLQLPSTPSEGVSTVLSEISPINYRIFGKVFYRSGTGRGTHLVTATQDSKPVLHEHAVNLESTSFLSFPSGTVDKEAAIEHFAYNQILEPCRHLFRNSRHLSPLRRESERIVQVASPPQGDIGHEGEYSVPHFVRLLKSTTQESQTKVAFIQKHLASVANVGKPSVYHELKGYLSRLAAINLSTSASCYLADFGFGVSQCLPIFIQGALNSPGQILIVEQPEAQLHPTAQIAMGSYFAELWNTYRIPQIIETHSSNLILRLRRLIKEGILSPEDINIGYLFVENGTTKLRNISISRDGEMEDGLPMEFFGGDLLEALQMSALT